LETALSRLFSEPVKVTGAGRTDSGVHATGQVVSLATDARFPFGRLSLALRGLLPRDCSIRDAALVAKDFSARFCAQERTYVYAILNRRDPSALARRYAHHVVQRLDLQAMKEAAEPLLGEHDFRAFATARRSEATVRRLHRVTIERRGEFVQIAVAADGFLHHMVRIVVGTLIECGLARRPAAELASILEGQDRNAAGATAPAHGLYLAGVRYPDGYDSFAEPPILRSGYDGPAP
jgi:tRNA pseudouridine38-40 synthase